MVLSLRTLLAATTALLLGLSADARAGWFPAEPIDGPSPDILAFGDLDMARDGSGGLVYVKRHDGTPHVFLARFHGGAWHPPERVDVGVDAAASEPVVAAADNHRLLIAWVAAGKLFGSFTLEGPVQPLSPPQQLWDGGVSAPDADVGINQTGYVAFTTSGGGGSDVHAVRLQGSTWEPVGPPLDIGEAQPAGDGAGAADVAVSAEGNAVVVWGETAPDGRRRVYSRRVTGTTLSVAPQELTLDTLEGQPGGDGDSPDIEVEDDGSFAWAAFRQDIGGRSRTIARRLLGSTFEPPVAVDGGHTANSPALSLNGRGMGVVASGVVGDNGVAGSLLEHDLFSGFARWDGGPSAYSPLPVVYASDKEQASVAWRTGPAAGDASVVARYRDAELPFEDPLVLSNPAFGTAVSDGVLRMSGSRLGDIVVGFLQGGEGDRRVVVASYDRPPGTMWGLSSENWRRTKRPTLKWRPGVNLWGPTQFKLIIDGVEVGSVADSAELRVPEPLADGSHVWTVQATDQRGQQGIMKSSRRVRIDGNGPRARVSIQGRRKAGSGLRIRVRLRDGKGSGARSAVVHYGDGMRTKRRRSIHVYRRPGRYTLRVRAKDRVGNVRTTRVKLRIRR